MIDYTLNPKVPLTAVQNEVVDYMIRRPACVNACQTGLGKTYTTLTAMAHVLRDNKDLLAILVVPPKALKIFRKELSTKLKVSFSELSKHQNTNGNSRVFLLSHTSLRDHTRDIENLRNAGYKLMLIIDEAHILQGEENDFTQLVRRIRHKFCICWLLTATPMGNDIWGLYNLMYLINPKIFGSKEEFMQKYLLTEKKRVKEWNVELHRYTFPWVDVVVGYKDIARLQDDIKDYVIIRQNKYNLEFIYHKTDLNIGETEYYLKASAGMARDTAKKNWAVRCNDLQQVVDNVSAQYSDKSVLSSKEVLLIQSLVPIIKDHAVIIYAEQQEVIQRLKTLMTLLKQKGQPLGNIYEITGWQDFAQRAYVEDHLTKSDVVLITQAGTESINLQAADTIFLYDVPFSIKVFIQLVGRITRIDTRHDKQYIHFIEASNTIDTYKRLLISLHGDTINRIFGDIETLPVELTVIDGEIQSRLKNKLLWSFKNHRLPTEDEIERIIYS